jgi:hypothetical protein
MIQKVGVKASLELKGLQFAVLKYIFARETPI